MIGSVCVVISRVALHSLVCAASTSGCRPRSGYGLFVRNQLYIGHGKPFNSDGSAQWIVEHNHITGTSTMSGGNSMSTGTTPVMHHTFWGRNVFKFDWSQDREVMTYDGGKTHFKYAPLVSGCSV